MAARKRRTDEPVSRDNVIEAPMTPRQLMVSDLLRDQRIEYGLDIMHVAEALRIRPGVLTAIEDGNFDLLPGPAYAIGFVRSYATYLGMDAEALVARFKAEGAQLSNRPQLHFPLPIRDSRVPTGPLLVICVLLAVLTYAGWYYFNATPDQLADIETGVPERLKHLLEPPRGLQSPAPASAPAAPKQDGSTVASPNALATTAPAAMTGPAAAPTPASSAASNPSVQPNAFASANESHIGQAAQSPTIASGDIPEAVDGVPPVEGGPIAPGTGMGPAAMSAAGAGQNAAPDMAQPVQATSTEQPAKPPTAFGGPEGQSRVVLNATGNSWIQVRDRASNLIFTRMLKPGEHYNVPNGQGLTLIAGNAGALDVTVDGRKAPRIGELGQVMRNVSLDPEHLLEGEPHAN
jgi:cytoskeletal protein RodZ